MKLLYSTQATSTHGRDGQVESEDRRLTAKLAMPKELGGSGAGTNPEQLFAAGYAACFENALIYLARERKLKLTETSVTAQVGMGRADDGAFHLTVSLEPRLRGISPGEAEALIAEADRCCPYSNAIRGNVEKKIVPR